MKRTNKIAAAALLAAAVFLTINAMADGEWLRTGPVWIKGKIFAGSGKVTITDTTGNLSTTSGTFSGNISGATGTLSGNLIVAGTMAVTGTSSLVGDVTLTGELKLGITAAVASSFDAHGGGRLRMLQWQRNAQQYELIDAQLP